MFKNIASQKITVFNFTTATNVAKTGDAANMGCYVSKDDGTLTVLGTNTATEIDATHAPGYYTFTLAQAETNADKLLFASTTSTSGCAVIAVPAVVYTTPNRFTTLVIDAAGLADANAVKCGATGAGTAITARDIGASVLLSTGTGTGQLDFTSGVVKSNMTQVLGGTCPAVTTTGIPKVDMANILGTAVSTPATAGILDVNVKNMNNVAGTAITTIKAVQGLTTADTIATYTGNTPQTGDSFARIGAAGAGLTAITGVSLAAGQKVDVDTIKTNPVVNAGTITFPTTATLASTTNITAGTITTATNLTNAPTAGDFTSTMKTSLNAATPAVTVSDKTGFSLTAAYDAAKTAAQASDIPTANISAIKTQTDKMAFTVTNQIDCNIIAVNSHNVTGDGHSGTEWGPA